MITDYFKYCYISSQVISTKLSQINPGRHNLQKKQTQTARFAATEILCRLYQTRLPVKVLFDKSVVQYNLEPADRNLTMQLVYGVLRHRQYLDRILEILSKTPLKKIEPFIHQSIVTGLYQIFFLKRIPESAAVNEAVNNCKNAKIPKRLQGFVNGILRQSIRQKEDLKNRAKTDKLGAVLFNHPAWLVQKWQKQFSPETASQICTNNSQEPAMTLRVNTTHLSRELFLQQLEAQGIESVTGHYSPDAVILLNFSGSITNIPGFGEGFFQVQDEAAQLATMLFGTLLPGGKYLDGCAGLGTKTAHLLQLGSSCGIDVHAVEPEAHRQKLFAQNLSRLFPGKNPMLHCGNLQQFSSQELPLFDGILIDAPCSGTGVTGRHPDIRWNRRQEDIIKYQKEQKSILAHSATLLAPQGTLIYATCSLEKEENYEVIDSFLTNNTDFTLTNCASQLPETAHHFVTDNCFAPLPSDKIDGFFAARLVRS